MKFLLAVWNKLKSNPIFVAAYSAAVGAVVSAVQDEMATGHIDWTKAGISKLVGFAATAAVAAVVHLYRDSPNTNNATPQPQNQKK